MAALLELEKVTAGYGGGDVLHDLDLGVEEGAITCIVGPNGAGKSTVLRLVSGLLRPRRGELRFRGLRITGLSPRAILRWLPRVPGAKHRAPEESPERFVGLVSEFLTAVQPSAAAPVARRRP